MYMCMHIMAGMPNLFSLVGLFYRLSSVITA